MGKTVQWTDDDLIAAVAGSSSWAMVIRKLGYAGRSGKTMKALQSRAGSLGLAVEHLERRPRRTAEEKREYERQWYADNPHRRQAVSRTRKGITERNRQHVIAVLTVRPCEDCGMDDLRVLDFDHRPDEEKLTEVSKMIRQGHSIAAIDAEIAKCDVVCANCHRIRTAGRDGRWRKSMV